MKIAVTGSDKRFVCLMRLLKDAGHEVLTDTVGADVTVTKWPPLCETCGKTVACGPDFAPEGVIDLLRDEDYQHEIAWMTAEGAVFAAMGRNGSAIRGAECMIVGWGRIGRALARILSAMGANVTVLSRRSGIFGEITAAGAAAALTCDAENHIGRMKYVFSTPPHMVIDGNVLKNAAADTVIIDLASPPYGVDIDAAERMGVRAWHEPGLPGRYCPENAARAIYEAMLRSGIMEGGF